MAIDPGLRSQLRQSFAANQKDYEKASAGLQLPPPGTYTCVMGNPQVAEMKIKQGPNKGKSFPQLKLSLTVVDGPLKGSSFPDNFSAAPNKDKTNHFGLGRAKALASMLNVDDEGHSLGEVEELLDALEMIAEYASDGDCKVVVEITSDTDEKGKVRKNVTIVQVIGNEDDPSPDAATGGKADDDDDGEGADAEPEPTPAPAPKRTARVK